MQGVLYNIETAGADARASLTCMKHWYDIARTRALQVGLSYAEIADRLGVSKSTVGHWLTGRNQARIDTIRRIASVLDVPVSTLIEADAYYLTDETERKLIDQLRQAPPEARKHVAAMIAAYLATVHKPGD